MREIVEETQCTDYKETKRKVVWSSNENGACEATPVCLQLDEQRMRMPNEQIDQQYQHFIITKLTLTKHFEQGQTAVSHNSQQGPNQQREQNSSSTCSIVDEMDKTRSNSKTETCREFEIYMCSFLLPSFQVHMYQYIVLYIIDAD